MDIAGSKTIVRDLAPEDNMAIMNTALQYLAAPFEAQGGTISVESVPGEGTVFTITFERKFGLQETG